MYQKGLIDMCNCKPDFVSDDPKDMNPPDSMRPVTFLGLEILEADLQGPCSSFHLRQMPLPLQYLWILDVPKATIYMLLFVVIRLHARWKWNSDTWQKLGAPNLPSSKSSPASRTSGCYLPWEQQGLEPPYSAKVQRGNVMNLIFNVIWYSRYHDYSVIQMYMSDVEGI